MTRMLASVRDLAEVRIALEGGADILDLKEPAAGALGAVSLPAASAAVRLVSGRVPVSATIGDLPMDPGRVRDAVAATLGTGVSIVKIGLFNPGPFEPCLDAVAPIAHAGAVLVAVMFADQLPNLSLLRPISAAGFRGVMLDTAAKDAGGLRTHLSDDRLQEFVEAARSLGLFAGLAGSLMVPDIAPLLRLNPAYLGFRGVLCAGGVRGGALDPHALADVRRLIPPPTPPSQSLVA